MAVKQKIRMLCVGTLAFLVLGLMYAWSVIRIQLTALYPTYTATQMSFCFTLTMIFFCLGGFAGSNLTARRTPAFSLRIASVLLLIGFFGASMLPNFSSSVALILLYVCYGVFAGFGTGIAFNAILANIAPWFPDHMGLCSGVLLMGFGLSSLLYALLIGRLIGTYSIFQLIRFFGILIFFMMLLASCFVRKPQLRAPSAAAEALTEDSVPPHRMIRSPGFWVYFIWNCVCGGAGLMIINNAANIAAYFGLIAGIGMVINLFNGCGRPVIGALVDRFGQFRTMLIMSMALILAAMLMLWADNQASGLPMLIGMVLLGIVYGGGNTVSMKVIRELYGPAFFGINHSICNFCLIGGSLLGPLISGMLQDRSSGGFRSTFLMLLVMGCALIVLLLLLRLCLHLEKKRAD